MLKTMHVMCVCLFPSAAVALFICSRNSAEHSCSMEAGSWKLMQIIRQSDPPNGVRGCRCTTRVRIMDAAAAAAGWFGRRGAARPWHLVLNQAVAADVHLRQQRVDVLAAQLQAGCHVA